MSQSGRIAKNTLIMYIRMCVMLLIGLYTSRVVLRTLGVEDYGAMSISQILTQCPKYQS